MKSGNKKIPSFLFYFLLLFAVFGVFLLYLGWVMHKDKAVKIPAGADYVIPYSVSTDYPDAVYYDFEKQMPAEVMLETNSHSGKKALLASPGKYNRPAVINIPLGSRDEEPLAFLRISAWIYAEASFVKEDAQLVLILSNPLNEVKFSKVISLRNNPKNQWFQVNAFCETASYSYNSNDRLRIFFKNNSETHILCDDVTVQFGKKSVTEEVGNSRTYHRGVAFSVLNTAPYPPLMMDFAGSLAGSDTGNVVANILNAPMVLTGRFSAANTIYPEILTLDASDTRLCVVGGLSKPLMSTRYSIPDTVGEVIKNSRAVCGDFDGDRLTEVLLWQQDVQKVIMAEFVQQGKNKKPVFIQYVLDQCKQLQTLLSLDAEGDHINELLAIDQHGNWNLLKERNGQWVSIASSENAKEEWNAMNGAVSMTVFPAEKPQGHPVIMSIGQGYKGKTTQYSLYVYDRKNKDFVSMFKKNNGKGVFVGKDRLSPEDHLIPCKLSAEKNLQCIRVRDDWRFDAQFLVINDTSYTVLGNIGFNAPEGRDNPKYCEQVMLVPVNAGHGKGALLVIYGPAGKKSRPDGVYGMDVYKYNVSKDLYKLRGE